MNFDHKEIKLGLYENKRHAGRYLIYRVNLKSSSGVKVHYYSIDNKLGPRCFYFRKPEILSRYYMWKRPEIPEDRPLA